MYSFNIDRGGTFTDFYVQTIEAGAITSEHCFKVPSLSSQGEGPIVGIKQFMISKGLMTDVSHQIPTKHLASLNIGTTIATNALLERKGCQNTMIVSKGFKDILHIRTQARPDIFDLSCRLPAPLATNIIEVSSRIYCSPVEIQGKQLHQISEGVFYEKPSEQEIELVLQTLKGLNPQSIGISLCNSYLSSVAEEQLAKLLRDAGFQNIESGCSFGEQGYLKRTQTANLDAYLNPLIQNYFEQLLVHFDEPEQVKLRVMKSDGGFTSKSLIKASSMLLSGPAGGLIGYCRMADLLENDFGLNVGNLLGLDMGGTSTDVSKAKDRKVVLNYSFEAEGIEICTPHLEIETIAAGGGSQLGFSRGILTVGPESVGSNPGPVCYGLGEQLALTDANLILNRLDASFFPKVFGKDRCSGIDRDLSLAAFEKLRAKVNSSLKQQKSIFELAEGYIEVANELMAKSARKILTLGKPDALIIFGSAAGQHCCDVADKIGVENVFIHRFSGILSAYGLSKAHETKQVKTFIGIEVGAETFDYEGLLQLVEQRRNKDSKEQSFDTMSEQLSIGYVGTSYSFQVPLGPSMLAQFEKLHLEQNGFTLPTKRYRLDYLIERYTKYPEEYQINKQISEPEDCLKYLMEKVEVFFNGSFSKINKYLLEGMKNCVVDGPALLMSATSSIFVKPNWSALILDSNIRLTKMKTTLPKQMQEDVSENIREETAVEADPIKLTIYSTRLMGIAEEMGKVLRKTSISTNIKERLDFSCGIFDWDGSLLANAPHLPVHLGSMETAVVEQIKRGIKPGDVVLTNHPAAGGSHLPDLTVVSCFEIAPNINFYVASRGHHADIGGMTPGSMPPFSKQLSEEGVAIQTFPLIRDGTFLEAQVRQLFAKSRRIDDNVSDLVAQIAANQIGIRLLQNFIAESGVSEFSTYVKLICVNAKQCVEDLLESFCARNNFPSIQTIENEEYMDDGTLLRLSLTLDRTHKKAIFDFTGTGPEVLGNTNAPKSITRSAVLYCLRSLIGKEIPLNSGCLIPVQIIIPENSILNPSKEAAVVGGNVETSQKLVDLILKPFNYVACSQGTMNNFLFGNEKYSYYETICGGSGAGDGFNGQTVQCHMTNTRITDVEHLERNYPVVLKKFQRRAGSGGKGQYEGGLGVTREVLFLQEMEVSVLSERRVFRAYGLEGGQSGQVGRNFLIKKNGLVKSIGSKSYFIVKPNESVRIETPGGGGYGKQPKQ